MAPNDELVQVQKCPSISVQVLKDPARPCGCFLITLTDETSNKELHGDLWGHIVSSCKRLIGSFNCLYNVRKVCKLKVKSLFLASEPVTKAQRYSVYCVRRLRKPRSIHF